MQHTLFDNVYVLTFDSRCIILNSMAAHGALSDYDAQEVLPDGKLLPVFCEPGL